MTPSATSNQDIRQQWGPKSLGPKYGFKFQTELLLECLKWRLELSPPLPVPSMVPPTEHRATFQNNLSWSRVGFSLVVSAVGLGRPGVAVDLGAWRAAVRSFFFGSSLSSRLCSCRLHVAQASSSGSVKVLSLWACVLVSAALGCVGFIQPKSNKEVKNTGSGVRCVYYTHTHTHTNNTP